MLQGLYLSLALSFARHRRRRPGSSILARRDGARKRGAPCRPRVSDRPLVGDLSYFRLHRAALFFDALGLTRVTMAVTLVSFPINVLLNYVMIFGKWGFPAMGGVGAGYASALTYWIVLAIGVAIAVRKRPFSDYKSLSRPTQTHRYRLARAAENRCPSGPFDRLGSRDLRYGGPLDEPLWHPGHRRPPVGDQLWRAYLHVSRSASLKRSPSSSALKLAQAESKMRSSTAVWA